MLKYFEFGEGGIVESARRAGPILVATAPDESDRATLLDEFELDEYDLASTLDPDEVPRLEIAGSRALIIWKIPESATVSQAVELSVSVVGLALEGDRLALLRASGDIAFADREFRRVADVREAIIAYLHRSVRHFVGHLRVIKQISNEIERKITVSMENKHLLQMFNLSESLVYYVDAIEGNAAVLTKLRSVGSQLGFSPLHLEMLDDLILDNAQAARQADIYSSVISGLMDARGTIVNNNVNVLLKNLTLINIVFLPLNLIASIGGMSEWTMMTNALPWPLSYAIFSLGMGAIGWGTWLLMKKVVERGAARSGGE